MRPFCQGTWSRGWGGGGGGRHDLACAARAGRAHPVFGLWPVRCATTLRHALAQEGIRKVDTGRRAIPWRPSRFADRPIDPFFNINRPEDLAAAAALLPAERGTAR